MSNENEWLERGTLRKSEKIEREHYRGDEEGEEEEEEEELFLMMTKSLLCIKEA